MKYMPRKFDLFDDMFDGFFPTELNRQGFDSIDRKSVV